MLQIFLWGEGEKDFCSNAMLSVLLNHMHGCVLTFIFKARREKNKGKTKKQQQTSPSYCNLVLHERLLQKQILLEMISVEAKVAHIIWSP